MLHHDAHLSDEELVLAADDELPASRRSAVRTHLSACWTCRARMREIEETIGDVVRAHRENLEELGAACTGGRAKLQGRLVEVSGRPASKWLTEFWGLLASLSLAGQWGGYAFTIGLLIVASVLASALAWRYSPGALRNLLADRLESPSLPDPRLTPGAVRSVTIAEVCSLQHEEVVRAVPSDLQTRVFREYGLRSPNLQHYEVDYLITPGLGGADQLSNLWPQPYSGAWNAHLKDTLEERLHEMVCERKIPLAIAQHDIATDWIAAYKKYLRTDKPAESEKGVNRPTYPSTARRERLCEPSSECPPSRS